ncbi:MAG: hypothetical protein K5799_04100 [Erythrobacter sp.]|nr:hypothetical protein [Erythrobacter sp.]
MKRLDRAKIIRERILETPRSHWKWVEISGRRAVEIQGKEWFALLSDRDNAFSEKDEADSSESSITSRTTILPRT